MQEPLVDMCEPHMRVTDYDTLYEIDVSTVTKEELEFDATFSLTAAYNQVTHALVAHFDVDFTHCPKPVKISTGPDDQYTHWKQTVFYFEDPVSLRVGDTLSGKFVARKNDKNPRDMNITIEFDVRGGEKTWTQRYTLR